MITINTFLPDTNPSRNPAPIDGATDAYETTAGTAGVYLIDFTSMPSVDDEFTISIAGLVLTFIGKATPNTSGYQWKVWNDALTFAQMVNNLKANYYLSKYFNIVGDYFTTNVTLTEKVPGESQLLDESTVVGPITITITTAVPQAFALGYKAVVEVHAQTDSTAAAAEDLKASFEVVPQADQTFAIADLSSGLKTLVTAAPPQLSDAAAEACPAMAAFFNLKIFEEYGTPVLAGHTLRQGSANAYPRAYFGGVHQRRHGVQDFEATFITATYKAFLTYLPQNHYVTKEQPIYLYLYVAADVTQLNRKFTIYYTDGTSSTITNSSASISNTVGTIYRLQAGYTQSDIEALAPTKTVWYLKFWVEDQSNVRISEQRNFYLYQTPQPGAEYLYFQNPLGGYDCVALAGYNLFGAKTEGDNEKLLYPAGSHYQGNYINAVVEKMYTLTGRTTLLNEAGSKWLADVLHTEHILFYNAELDRLEPLVIATRELQVWNKQQNLNAYELEFNLSRTE